MPRNVGLGPTADHNAGPTANHNAGPTADRTAHARVDTKLAQGDHTVL